MCDAIHSDEYLAMAKRYRAEVDRIDKERKQVRPAAVESKEAAIADLKRIRQALRTEWEAIKDSLDPKRIDDLLYCCTVFGLGENDTFAPIRTDWSASASTICGPDRCCWIRSISAFTASAAAAGSMIADVPLELTNL